MMTIGTRGSDLALFQARHVAHLLAQREVETQLQIIRTKGDEVQHLSFDKIEGKGFFTKELEDALLQKRVDLAVHSLKDLPSADVPGLEVAALLSREDPRDCLLVRRDRHAPQGDLLPLPVGAIVGTSAVRRRAQLVALRQDLQIKDLRGNVPTRVQRLAEGRYDAIVLAQAGLNRLQLDLSQFATLTLPADLFVPAPGQGALAIQIRATDPQAQAAVLPLHDSVAAECIGAERRLLARVEGGCHVPLGAHAWRDPKGLNMKIFWWAPGAAKAVRFAVQAGDVAALVEEAYWRVRHP